MRLGAIDIFGFKSFPHRTRVEFGPGVSAVVGPNGCGKSNIADAFRWALGEQSAKSLRGDVMEDLIFNGSADTPPLSMAEVSLTFADVEGHLPGEAGELVVTRRMYRSGESHYSLNRQPVRLKDVRELFEDTGLGKASYAVIEQGMVEAIVKAKADERRAFFEEAAGIRGYRAKRAEAIRKLDDVRANMERLDDLYDEYRRRARALKRQAGAARRYQGLVDRLRELEVAFAKLTYREKAEAKREALAERDRCTAAAREAKARVATASAEVSRLEAELSRLELELERCEKDLLERQRGLHEAQAAKQLAEERHRAAESDFGRLGAERERLGEELTAAAARATEIADEIGRTEEKTREAEKRRAQTEQELASARAREAATAQEVEELRAEQLRRLHDRTRLANLHATAAATREALTQELRRLREEAGRQASLFDENYASLHKLVAEREALAAELAECGETGEALAAAESRLAGEFATAEAAVAELRTRREKTHSRLASLQELARRFESFEAGVATLYREGKPEGVAGLLADAVDVRAGYEAAVERALGSAAGALLAEGLPTATAYGGRLREAGTGRAAFVVPREGPPPSGDLPVVEGVRGWAADFVAVEGEFAGAVRALLAGVVVVEDLEALAATAEVCPGLAVVTLGGDWWDGRATLLAGAAEEVSATILRRRAEIDRLSRLLERVEEALARRRRELGRLATAREEHARRRQDTAARLLRLEAAHGNAGAALARAREEGRTLEAHRGVLEAEIAGTEGRLAEAFGEEERLGAQLRATEQACEEAGAAVARREAENQEARGDVAAREQALAAGREDLVRLREQLKSLRAERDRLAQGREEGEARREALGEALARRREEAAELAAEQEECEQEIGDRGGVFREAEAEVKERRLIRAELMGRRREAEEARAAAESDATEVADSLREKEIVVTSLTGELNASEEAVAAKHGVRLSVLGEEEYILEGELAEAEAEKDTLARRLSKMGEVNFLAAREYEELAGTLAELEEQRTDLAEARANLDQSIARLDAQSREKFLATFEQVKEEFQRIFREVFVGGQADLKLQPGVDPLEAGIYVYAQPPGKKMEHLSLLSGGEKALSAIALIFALFNVRPAPFAILDEVDAPLDENNIGRFLELLSRYHGSVQFMIITHARRTMEAADAIYGVTMERRGVSKVLSLRLEEVPEEFTEVAVAAPAVT
jgi:chromosome segregation protein